MTEIKPFDALTAFVSKDVPRLSEVLAQIVADAGLIETRRRDLASALRSIARALDRPLEALPADVRWLRAHLARIPPARLGISRKRWLNVISDALAALRHVGMADRAATRRIPLTSEWQQLWRNVEDRGLRNGLSRFVRFCSSLRISPGAVDDAVIAAYRIALDGGLLRPATTAETVPRISSSSFPDSRSSCSNATAPATARCSRRRTASGCSPAGMVTGLWRRRSSPVGSRRRSSSAPVSG